MLCGVVMGPVWLYRRRTGSERKSEMFWGGQVHLDFRVEASVLDSSLEDGLQQRRQATLQCHDGVSPSRSGRR